MTEKKVAVIVVLVNFDFERDGLCASFGTYGLRFGLLLGGERRNAQLAKLQIGFDTEKRCASGNERPVELHAHISGFDILDYIIFLALESQFSQLLVEVKRGFGVVIQSEIDFIAHRSGYVHLNFLIEVRYVGAACTLRKNRIVDKITFETENEFCRSLCFDLHTTRSKNFIGRPEAEFHIGR